jgi:endonuclease-3 related protein
MGVKVYHLLALRPIFSTGMLREVYQKLLKSYGEQNWWPAETPFEVCVGALLTQNTAWRNVEKAISNLKRRKLFTPEKILECRKELLEELIRPAGFLALMAFQS